MSEQKPWECPDCGQGPADGLELTPSGKQIKTHKYGDETHRGKAPQSSDPEPVKVVKAGTSPNTAECVECGEEQPKLKTPGKVRKHINPQTLEECEQRADVEADCPVCERTGIKLRKMRFVNHKDLKANAKCPASGKTVSEAQALGKKAPVKAPKKQAAKKPDNGYKDLPPLGKSIFKATKLGNELKAYPDPWRFTVEQGPDPDQATLVARRGTGKDVEEMRISWWAGACLGGDGKITHEFRGRKIAVRNANAVRMRGQMSHEQIKEEAARVTTRKSNGSPKTKKTPQELQALMPFNPTDDTPDEEVLSHIREGRVIRWTRVTDGQVEKDVVRKIPAQPLRKTKSGIRNLTFTGDGGTRTVRVANLVSVG